MLNKYSLVIKTLCQLLFQFTRTVFGFLPHGFVSSLRKKKGKIKNIVVLLIGIYDDDPEIITLDRGEFGKFQISILA